MNSLKDWRFLIGLLTAIIVGYVLFTSITDALRAEPAAAQVFLTAGAVSAASAVQAEPTDPVLAFVNTASADTLAKYLKGVGPVKAARIVAARPFAHVDSLITVKGIGPKTLANIKGATLPSRR